MSSERNTTATKQMNEISQDIKKKRLDDETHRPHAKEFLKFLISLLFLNLLLIEKLFSFFTEIYNFMYEQDGAAIARTTSITATVDGVRQTRTTSEHKQRIHEATAEGAKHIIQTKTCQRFYK